MIGSNATTENVKHKFGEFLKESGVKHILAGVQHPQTNGKIERFFALFDTKKRFFKDIDELIEFPEVAFVRKLPEERIHG